MEKLEIERKFLVKNLPAYLNGCDKTEIEQAYVSVRPVIRIRRMDDRFFLTVKGEGFLSRQEFEMEIGPDEYVNLSGKIDADTIPIAKTRYYFPIGQYTGELDIYYGRLGGLMTVEVEFGNIDDAKAFIPPEWFGREVTGEAGYANSSLSTHGLPES